MWRHKGLSGLVFIMVISIGFNLGNLVQAEELEDERIIHSNASIVISPQLKRAKRKFLKKYNWLWKAAIGEQLGYTNNLYLSPTTDGVLNDLEKSSNYAATALRLGLVKKLGPVHKLGLNLTINDTRYSLSDLANVTSFGADCSYQFDLNSDSRLSLSGSGKYKNDDALDIYGQSYTRDFSYYKYQVNGGFKQSLGSHHLEAIYLLKWKDYAETINKNSLDWFEHGPQLRYKANIHSLLKVRLWYELLMQSYDEEPANSLNGREQVGNPIEKHNYHKLLVWINSNFTKQLKASAKYRLRLKEDQFVDYESYTEHGVEFAAQYLIKSLNLSMDMSWFYKDRQYDHRPAETLPDTLVYDKSGFSLQLAYFLQQHISLVANLSTISRTTNRITGSSYMDYDVQSFSAGVALAF